jgi:YegS/Rv2252/BmrU family lipid kinase
MKKSVLFIINPIAGRQKKNNIANLIERQLDKSLYQISICFTQGKGHAAKISSSAISEFDTMVAVGGDGTINEVAGQLVNTQIRLGIIPLGSGNGLARFLKIPLSPLKALQCIINNYSQWIDTALIDQRFFINAAGIGFDARVAHRFAELGKRGLSGYARAVLKEYWHYSEQLYGLSIDGRKTEVQALMISFANASQFGNNFHIAPKASVTDGLLDVCVLRKAPLSRLPNLAWQSRFNLLDRSAYWQTFSGKEIELQGQAAMEGHVDGEAVMFSANPVFIKIIPRSLQILCPIPD